MTKTTEITKNNSLACNDNQSHSTSFHNNMFFWFLQKTTWWYLVVVDGWMGLRWGEVECSVAFISTLNMSLEVFQIHCSCLLYGYNYTKLLLAAGLDSVLFSPLDIWYGGRVLDWSLVCSLRGNSTPPVDLVLSFNSVIKCCSCNLASILSLLSLGWPWNYAAFMYNNNNSRCILLDFKRPPL